MSLILRDSLKNNHNTTEWTDTIVFQYYTIYPQFVYVYGHFALCSCDGTCTNE